MIFDDELRLISSWTTPTTHGCPYYTVILYCMIEQPPTLKSLNL